MDEPDAERERAVQALAADCARLAAGPYDRMLAELCEATYRAALRDGDTATWRDLWHLVAALVRSAHDRADAAYARLAAFVAENNDLELTPG